MFIVARSPLVHRELLNPKEMELDMTAKNITDLLPFVQKPSRYLGTEVNRIQKDPAAVELKIALAFPDLYDIGTSHFGIQILYHQLNKQKDILAERVFAPGKDMEALLRRHRIPLPSMESRRAIGEFDIVGFSLLYELNYTNVLNMLDLGGIPLRWKNRTEKHPFIVAGGPSVCNPEPMAEFFDAMVFGDGEDVILEIAKAWIGWKQSGNKNKAALLEKWSQLEGVYVPQHYKASYDEHGFQQLLPIAENKYPISRVIAPDLDQAVFPDLPIIPFGKPIHDRLRLEISRGCTRGCRFCQAGMIYRPVRERSAENIMALIQKALSHTGYEDLSLLSLSTGDYTCLTPLMECLMQLCRCDHVAVSLPSLRAGSLTPELMQMIRSVRKTGFTIAPEAGSQRLRDVINKNITYEDVAATVKDAFELGWHVIKLYFMIGLPTETEEDLDAIVDMVQKLKRIKKTKNQKGKINVSLTTFVPKPHTPFQWASQISLETSKKKLACLKEKLKMPGVQVKWQKPEMSLLEGILARGDRRVGNLIEKAWQNGCTFDGWNDQFDFDGWRQAIRQCEINPHFFTTRQRDLEEPLPWQHMDVRIDTAFFKEQWHASFQGDVKNDCRYGVCHACGVCDFDEVRPKIYENCTLRHTSQKSAEDHDHFKWFSLRYTKLGEARFFGHLELSNIFSRAIRRAGIKVQYSKGFHPMPKLSFDDPLPLGIESHAEDMRVSVSVRHDCQEVLRQLNHQLPSGVRITKCQLRSSAKIEKARNIQRFCIKLTNAEFDQNILNQFNRCQKWPYLKINHKGRERKLDLKKAILKIESNGKTTLSYEIAPNNPETVRPSDVVVGIFKMSIDLLKGAKVMKLKPRDGKCTVDNGSSNS